MDNIYKSPLTGINDVINGAVAQLQEDLDCDYRMSSALTLTWRAGHHDGYLEGFKAGVKAGFEQGAASALVDGMPIPGVSEKKVDCDPIPLPEEMARGTVEIKVGE